jgi:SAM-dependent methyltransferase
MTYDPATYWPERYRRQGDLYVAKGGRRESYRRQLKAITPYLLALPRGAKVLDYGCGPQRFRPALNKRYAEYIGMDLMLEMGTEPITPLPERDFDAAVCIMVLQHIADEGEYDRVIRDLFAGLGPDGVLFVVDANPAPKLDDHMRPRGPAFIADAAPWSHVEVVGEWDGHWIGRFWKGALSDGPVTVEPEPARRLPRGTRSTPDRERPVGATRGRIPQAFPPGEHPAALILGGGPNPFGELAEVEAMIGREWPGLVVAVNDVGIHYTGRLDHWCSLHYEKLVKWNVRRADMMPKTWLTWSKVRAGHTVDRTLAGWTAGSSGLLGVGVALELGCTHIVLCGIPMTIDTHFPQSDVHDPNKPWKSANGHWGAWKRSTVLSKMGDRVRSMSGRTRERFGAPTPEWLEGAWTATALP